MIVKRIQGAKKIIEAHFCFFLKFFGTFYTSKSPERFGQ